MPAPHAPPADYEVALADRAATRRLAGRLARLLRAGDVIGLGGALGAGKTTFARDVIHALGGRDCEVPSPTFTLLQTYELGALTVWHFDLFRVDAPEDVVELGFEDALADGVSLVEWPERLGPLLPPDHLVVTLAQGAAPDARIARLSAHGDWTGRLAALVEDLAIADA